MTTLSQHYGNIKTTLWQQTTIRQQTIKQHYDNIKATIKQQICLNQQ